MIEGPGCKECGGKCCLHPHIQPNEYKRMNEVLGIITVRAAVPERLKTGWWQFRKACPALSSEGCRHTYEDRPLACKLYPFEMLRYPNGFRIMLDVSICPHWPEFGKHYSEALEAFQEGIER